jgi:hypothetical protein
LVIAKKLFAFIPFWLCLCPAVAMAQAPAAPPIVPPFESTNNHLFVQVRVNDSAPLWFMFDSELRKRLTQEGTRRLTLRRGDQLLSVRLSLKRRI